MLKKLLLTLMLVVMTSTIVFANSQNEALDSQDDGPVVLTLIDAQAYALDRYDVLIQNYQALHPEITFEIQHIANDYTPLRMARINSGQVPDIMVGQSGSDVSKLYDYAYDFTNDALTEKFTKSALASSTTEDGKILSLPWIHENMSLIYNKDLFNKAGITTLPRTLDELEATCETLVSAGITPFGVAFKESWVVKHVISHFIALENVTPRDTINAITNGDIKFSELEGMENSFRLIDLMLKYGADKPLETGWEQSENMLSNGEVAMIHMGDWAEAVLKDFNPDVNMGFLPMPISNNPEDAVVMSYVSWQYVLNKDSKNFDEAKEFLEYLLTSEDAADWMGNAIAAAPPLVDATETSGLLSNDALKYISEGRSKAWNHVLLPSGFSVGETYQDYILGELSADEVLESLTEEWIFLTE